MIKAACRPVLPDGGKHLPGNFRCRAGCGGSPLLITGDTQVTSGQKAFHNPGDKAPHGTCVHPAHAQYGAAFTDNGRFAFGFTAAVDVNGRNGIGFRNE